MSKNYVEELGPSIDIDIGLDNKGMVDAEQVVFEFTFPRRFYKTEEKNLLYFHRCLMTS